MMRVTDERLMEISKVGTSDFGEFQDIIADLQDARAEIERLKRIADAADELTVDAGYTDKEHRTVTVNAHAYETFAQTLFDTGWWSADDIEAEKRHMEGES